MAAGLGFKTFTTGEVLTAADTNGYLMQGVLVFASAAARDAAITSPQEGQCCYLKDTDAVLTYSGAAWVGFDDTNAIQNTIVDAKGDLIAASAADTPARLAVGNNGEQIVADSAATTGLRYSATPSASNPVLNSAMQVWQRGTSVAAALGVYAADRWLYYFGGTGTVTRQTTSDTTNLPAIQYCSRVQRTAANTTTSSMYYAQSFESINSIPFAGKTVTLSFYARAGANYSPTSSLLVVTLSTGTGTDQNVITGAYTGQANPIQTSATLTTTWQRFTYTGNLSASMTEMALYFQATPTGTAGANDYFEVTGVQIDIGSVALPFRTYAATIQGELAACQRYYYQLGGISSAGGGMGNGHYYNTTNAYITSVFPVTMRTQPTCAAVNIANFQTLSGGSARATTAFGASSTSPYAATSAFTTAVATLGYGAWLDQTNANAALTFSAEL